MDTKQSKGSKKRLYAVVSGIVQGVGYRYFVMRSAEALGLSGWVRNLPDGNVDLLAEGDERQLEELIYRLRQGPFMSRVDDVKTEWLEYIGEFYGFSVRF